MAGSRHVWTSCNLLPLPYCLSRDIFEYVGRYILSNQAHTVLLPFIFRVFLGTCQLCFFVLLFIYIYGCGISLHKLFPLSNLLILSFGMVMPTKFAILIQNVILKLATFITLYVNANVVAVRRSCHS